MIVFLASPLLAAPLRHAGFAQHSVGVAYAAPIIADTDLAILDVSLNAVMRRVFHLLPARKAGIGGEVIAYVW